MMDKYSMVGMNTLVTKQVQTAIGPECGRVN